ncbi:integrase regulator RinA [Melissococcus plutonius]|nr:integrase regulator RinA [Melissococcus plutonius S1]KMT23883.1 integrase regulator RinA [Melissococcus plutonius]KMT24406.1 integrase regulator RinA [Melissococcus plutonius]KMT25979.1 integrase regulator RinA [Melissococcus plutonius]KMT28529.1 integrase regulator RinA [Melissococcus plutonius]
MLITIEQDRRLASLARNKRIIADTINAADEETKTIIKELYLKKYPQYNIQGLIDHQLIFCSRSQVYNLRNKFFGDIAIQLNLEI